MKVVLDTNILLSGLLLPEGAPGKIVQAWNQHAFELVLSEFQLHEIGRVLAYPKISNRLCWGQGEIEAFLRQLYLRSVWLGRVDEVAEVPADADDNLILSAFVVSGAECLVTGDKDLLALRDQCTIMTAGEFVKRL